ncbi:hypothetical protein AA313_de0207617 [Arthrobotrys entomopaga]|nr:hypothetical protein AA313_de0207617 [Arthrobotrys entomopaga]
MAQNTLKPLCAGQANMIPDDQDRSLLCVPVISSTPICPRSHSPTPLPSPAPPTKPLKMNFQAPAAFNQAEEMQSGVVRNLHEHIGQLHDELGVYISDAERAGLQLEEVKALILKSREKLTAAATHVDHARQDLQQVQDTFGHIDRVIGLQLGNLDLAADIAEEGAMKKQADPPAQEQAKALKPGRQATEIGSSTCLVNQKLNAKNGATQPIPTKAVLLPTEKPAIPLNKLYSWDRNGENNKPLDLSASKPTRAMEPPAKTTSPFDFEEKKISTHNGDAFIEPGPSRIIYPPPRFATGSNQSNVTVKPAKPTDPLRKPSKDEYPVFKDKTMYLSSTLSFLSDHETPMMTIPDGFDHAGNFPGRLGTRYDAAMICSKSQYGCEKVPVLTLTDIPKEVSLDDITSSLAGGPLYRISLNKDDPSNPFRSVRITFIHRQHALNLLEFVKRHHGLAIKSCAKRIQVLDDSKNRPNYVGYNSFVKIMTEHVTRSVYIIGLNPNFWTTEKFRDFVLAAVERLRVEDPRRYPNKEPFSEQKDIISYRLGSGETGIEAVIHLRSLGTSILVRNALHGLQQPEGFWKERCSNELGPTISPYDNPDTIPTLKAYYIRDPCDRSLDQLKT